MSGNRCNACNTEFKDEAEQRSHYRSEWHRHNLKRKVAGVPGVSESFFNLRLAALEAEKKTEESRLIYTCSICSKSYTTAKSHAQHLKSRLHLTKAADVLGSAAAVIRPAPVRIQAAAAAAKIETDDADDDDDSDDWEEVEGDVDVQSLTDDEDEDEREEWNAAQCFFCDAEPDGTVEGCVEHMHRDHGFFIPDAEFLKDAKGLLNYLGLKVTKGFMCLHCDARGKRFQSIEAVRKHMIAKSHCKLRYGEAEGEAEEELEDFYDFSASYDHRELMAVDEEIDAPVALTGGGFELILKSDDGLGTKTIGSREFQRYYKQRPKPTEDRNTSNAVRAVVSRYRSMGLATRQPNAFYRPKETKHLPGVKLEVMRSKLGMKNNVIRNLPKNCTY